jgi:hypothetical protein
VPPIAEFTIGIQGCGFILSVTGIEDEKQNTAQPAQADERVLEAARTLLAAAALDNREAQARSGERAVTNALIELRAYK